MPVITIAGRPVGHSLVGYGFVHLDCFCLSRLWLNMERHVKIGDVNDNLI